MHELVGKTAFVTGGASGIRLALGRAFAEAGMKVMLADIEAKALSAAVAQLRDLGPDVCGINLRRRRCCPLRRCRVRLWWKFARLTAGGGSLLRTRL